MKKFTKKSQGLSINTIIVAAIALAVLVVVLAIFTGSAKKTSENLGSCVTKGGECAGKFGGSCKEPNPIPLIVSGDCKEDKNLCCIKSP